MHFGKQLAIRITSDFVVNILASVIYTFARQIVVFPLLASRLSDNTYGTLLTICSLANVYTALVGGSLNNTRLVQDSLYQEHRVTGDFNQLNLIGGTASLIFSAVLWWLFDLDAVAAILLAVYILTSCLYGYSQVFFRLELNFKRIFLVNLLASLAYIIVAPLFATETLWPAVFLVGEGVGLIYTVVTTRFLREPWNRTLLFSKTAWKAVALALTNLLGNLLMYADRLIIYPTLGAANVSYYSVASFFGKCAGIVMTPIAGVLLGYFAQRDFKASRKMFIMINSVSLGCLTIFGVACWILAPWFTKLLYPTLYQQSAPYIFLANLGSVISIAGNVAHPMILKCCSMRWVLAVQVLYGGIYLLAVLLLIPTYGLYGFCWAAILSNGVRLLALYALGYCKL